MNNVIFVAGLAVFFGSAGGRLFQKLRIPQVVGYIIVGLLIGKSFLHVFAGDVVQSMTPLVNFTLGIIGCIIGGELRGETFRKYGKSIYAVLLGEGLFAFFAVTLAVTVLTGKLYLGLLLGAIASATDPASTVSVFWENKSKGPLTRTVTSVVALDDALALLIYGFASVFSKAMILGQSFSFKTGVGLPLLEIGECLVLGAVCALVVLAALRFVKDDASAVPILLGVIGLAVGTAVWLELDLILASMAMGVTLTNLNHHRIEGLLRMVKDMTAPLYILFFVAIGAQLDIQIFLKASMIAIVILYVLARSFGKILGAGLGAWVTKAKPTVVRYTGICLFTQGGVAMGLALSLMHNLSLLGGDAQQTGLLIINVVAATTFIVQMLGPPLVKLGVHKADEAFRDVTREDIIAELKVSDVLNPSYTAIEEGTRLRDIIRVVQEKETYNLPVVDAQGCLVGQISIDELKDAILEEDLKDFVLAEDIAVPVPITAAADQPLVEVYGPFIKRDLDFIPVVERRGSRRLVGIMERQTVNETIDRRLLDRRYSLE